MKNKINTFKAVILYFIFGIGWIFLSNYILFSLYNETSDDFFNWEIVKGIAFILVTTVVLYFVLKNFSDKLEQSNYELEKTDNCTYLYIS